MPISFELVINMCKVWKKWIVGLLLQYVTTLYADFSGTMEIY